MKIPFNPPSMEFLHFQKAASLILSLLFLSSSCSAQPRYFINCGSSDSATINPRQTFVGDINSDDFRISGDRNNILKDTNQKAHPIESLYQTARFFRQPSTYNFDIPQTGAYIICFHFYAFSSTLSDAYFNVSASGHMLLPNFTVGKSGSLILKEFYITINNSAEKFRIYFEPVFSLAFVNAIEVLPTTQNITRVTGPNVTPAGRSYKVENHGHEVAQVLETIYRINVGGKRVNASNDKLFRTWTPDDEYLINRSVAVNEGDGTGVNYVNGEATEDDAPDAVYGTAKAFSTSLHLEVVPNLTWQFNVSKGAKYLVRAHFCDVVSSNINASFKLYVYSKFVQEINPRNTVGQLGTPFHKDFIVDSDDFRFMNISVGPSNDDVSRTYFFLNGLEIMQVKNETAAEPPVKDSGSAHLGLIVGLVGSAVSLMVIVAAIAVVLLCHKKKKKKKSVEGFDWGVVALYGATSSHSKTPDRTSSYGSNLSNLQLGLKIPFVEIKQVTNYFDENLFVGEGGFGKVYKGTLRNGLKVAVKRSNPDHGQGLPEFQTEIMILSKIRHRHLVSLIGYCYEDGEMVLVYEFMEKGTLKNHLYGSSNSSSTNRVGLSWKQRLEICIGAAKGIDYLHTGAERGIIHRDVKSTNILLDENYVAKVADFGISRLGHLEETQVSTNVKGTFGYLDPEYFGCFQLTEKSDVYSFGVVLLEVLCARPALDRSLPKEQVNLAEWAMACYKEGHLQTVIDPLLGEINPNSFKKFCETVEKCLKENSVDRPPMSDVLWDLEYALHLQKEADQREQLSDTMTDASLNLPLQAVQRFPSQSLADEEDDTVPLYTSTGEVFSQMKFDDGIGR